MISDLLAQFIDHRSGGNDCDYNGYLEDYIHTEDGQANPSNELFQKIAESYPNAKVCVGLRRPIRKEVISNQIIGYKDAFKLEGNPMVYPYLIVLREDDQERLLIVVNNEDSGYLYAKALYFCLTEPGADFEKEKNNIIALVDDCKIMDVVDQCFDISMGSLQRKRDQEVFKHYEELYDLIIQEASRLKETIFELLIPLQDKSELVQTVVARWFLLKKLAYVQYMVDRQVAVEKHDGDIKEQRKEARIRSKKVPFVVFSELWRCSGSNLPKEETV